VFAPLHFAPLRCAPTHLLLARTHLLPLGAEELADLPEGRVGVLRLEALTVVLHEEHVGGEGAGEGKRCHGLLDWTALAQALAQIRARVYVTRTSTSACTGTGTGTALTLTLALALALATLALVLVLVLVRTHRLGLLGSLTFLALPAAVALELDFLSSLVETRGMVGLACGRGRGRGLVGGAREERE
jgi:hypothetical protein